MKYLLTLPVLLCYLSSFLFADQQLAQQEISQNTQILDEFVYIQQSSKGTLSLHEEGYYILTLKGNHLDIIYFADQPNRFAGQKELSPFFQQWSEQTSKENRPPTAFLNYTQFNAKDKDGVTPDILQLRNPHYQAETDTLTFEVMPLHEYPIQEGAFENVVIIYDKE